MSTREPLLKQKEKHTTFNDEQEYDEVDDVEQTNFVQTYERSYIKSVQYWLLCVLTVGLLPLIMYWAPKSKLLFTHTKCNKTENASQMLIQARDGTFYICPIYTVCEDGKSFKYYEYRHSRYVFDDDTKTFNKLCFHENLPYGMIPDCIEGINNQTFEERRIQYGQNLIDIQVKSALQLLVEEMIHPFFLFQIFSITIWCLREYYIFSACVLVISLISILSSLIITRRTLLNLRDMAVFETDVIVLRDSRELIAKSTDLVPGDIIHIENGLQMPCDAILISGQCVVNESMLTGESTPALKSQLPYREESTNIYSIDNDKQYTLYGGTRIIQTKNIEHPKPLAMVIRTGFSTAKGKLVLSILYPKPTTFKFYEDSMKFVAVLGLLAMGGFAYSLYFFLKYNISTYLIVIRSLEIITVTVPPALPLVMVIGTGLAISRLKGKKIFCISPQRVNVSGALDLLCFDKTGTLTEEGLDLLGIRPCNNKQFSDLATDPRRLAEDSEHHNLLYCLASCHSLISINGQLVGDPLDMKIFEATTWKLDESTKHKEYTAVVKPSTNFLLVTQAENVKEHEFAVLKRFDFVTHLQSSGVLVRNMASGCTYGFMKGSPERMKTVCIPSTVPKDYDAALEAYTYRGYRVIACASKKIGFPADRVTRQDVEKDLTFLGFVIMHNKLKDQTSTVFRVFNQANLRSVMVTGDSPLTAINVARQCHLVDIKKRVFLGDTTKENGIEVIQWVDVDSTVQLDPATLMPPKYVGDYELAVTGRCFQMLLRTASRRYMEKVLAGTQIFSRMLPDQKADLMKEFQRLEYTVSMCGDGANDCAALKAANVGVSLSQEEASIAAPFTSSQPTISCVAELIKEGRAALATSFQLFKYMAMYSIIQFASVVILCSINSDLSNWQYLLIDMAIILPLGTLMGFIGPYYTLHNKKPLTSLVSLEILLSLFGHIILVVAFQVFIFNDLKMQTDWFQPLKPSPITDANITSVENTVIFLFSSLQYISIALALSVFCKPFREPWYHNVGYLALLTVTTSFIVYLLFVPDRFCFALFQLVEIPTEYRVKILVLAFINGLLFIIWERLAPVFAGCKAERSTRYECVRAEFEKGWNISHLPNTSISNTTLASPSHPDVVSIEMQEADSSNIEFIIHQK